MILDRAVVEAALPAYEIGDELGRGAFGVVIAARHKRLRRDVAVKQLPRAFGADEDVRRRFMVEARVLASFDHPHIVPVHDYVEHEGLCLLIMERLDGGTLGDRIEAGRVTPDAACTITVATCAALQYAHEHRVLHRDVKPQNLMFSREGVLKVTDFGLSKVLGGSRATPTTRAGYILGSPAYMAPEQITGDKVSPATDVFAVGVVLYELLSGELPYAEHETTAATLFDRVNEDARPLRVLAPDAPPPLAAVVDRALARAPEDRFGSARELGAAVVAAATDLWGPGWADESDVDLRVGVSSGTRAPPAGASGASPRAEASRPPAPPPSAPADGPPLRRSRVVAAVVGGVLAFVAIAVGAFVLAGGRRATTRVVYADALADPAGGWAVVDQPDVAAAYVHGRYRLTVKRTSLTMKSDTDLAGSAARAELARLGDATISVYATPASGATGLYGAMCREAAGGDSYYAALIDGKGDWGIFRFDVKGLRPLARGVATATASPLRQAMSLACTGAGGSSSVRLALSVAGHVVGRATDPDGLAAGRAGVMVSALETPNVSVDFDHVTIRSS